MALMLASRVFYGWYVVLACLVLSLYVGSSVFWGFTAFFEPLVQEFGWSYAQVSFASSLRGLEMGVLAPLVGFLVDRFGARKLIAAGVVSVSIGLVVLSRTDSLAMFYAAFILLAFGAGGCTSVVLMVVISRWFVRNLGKAMGVMAAGFGMSGLMLPVIVWLIDTYGWRTTYLSLGLGMAVIGFPLLLVIREDPAQMGLLPDGGRTTRDGGDQGDAPCPLPEMSFGAALRSSSFLLLMAVETVRFMAVTSVGLHVMPYLSTFGISRYNAGLVAAGIPLVSVVGRVAFGWLGDTHQKKYVLATCFTLIALGMAAFCLVGLAPTPALVLFLLLFAPGLGGGMVLRGSIVREYFGQAAMGRLLGFVMAAASLGGLIGPTLAGWLYDTVGDYRVLWAVFSVAMLLTLPFILRLGKAD